MPSEGDSSYGAPAQDHAENEPGTVVSSDPFDGGGEMKCADIGNVVDIANVAGTQWLLAERNGVRALYYRYLPIPKEGEWALCGAAPSLEVVRHQFIRGPDDGERPPDEACAVCGFDRENAVHVTIDID